MKAWLKSKLRAWAVRQKWLRTWPVAFEKKILGWLDRLRSKQDNVEAESVREQGYPYVFPLLKTEPYRHLDALEWEVRLEAKPLDAEMETWLKDNAVEYRRQLGVIGIRRENDAMMFKMRWMTE